MNHDFDVKTFVESNTCHRYEFFEQGETITFDRVVELWEKDRRFRSFFNAILSESEFEAFRWETPAINDANFSRPFACVLLESDDLIRPFDDQSFVTHFGSAGEIVTFGNLQGDALLVVPSPLGERSPYVHLASFLRHANEKQTHGLWIAVAQAVKHRLGQSPMWLSTAGLGVAWLHVRLDSIPKYYGYLPFRSMPE